MKLSDFFAPITHISADQARDYLQNALSVQVLDVRQPSEYQQGHLPGAILIPLKELGKRSTELDRTQPVLVYCAVGGRSRVAAQMLVGQEFKDVSNLSGGIKAWQGATVDGPEDRGFDLLPPDAEFDHIFALAYAMEDRLERFYQTIARVHDNEVSELAGQLASFEKGHKLKLLSLDPGNAVKKELAANGAAGSAEVLEGAISAGDVLAQNQAGAIGTERLLETAAAFEAQAWDLYSRLARRSNGSKAKKLFTMLAMEEQTHLEYVSKKLDAIL